ncbi:MAG: hypothetical protein GXO26_07065 [Crenarchaeota archaeon]|nr:hypothetical protein [Thermoproteota archaeon]
MRKVPPGTDQIQRCLIILPLHITGIWKICWRRDEYESGSIGAGIVIEPGLKAEIKFIESKHDKNPIRIVELNGKKINLKNIEILNKLIDNNSSFIINCECNAPLGSGYGLSAALCITYSIALHKCLNIDKAIEKAHLAEVKSLLGLGDVIAEVYGGELEIRISPGAPKHDGKIIKICYRNDYTILTSELEINLTTDIMLREKYDKIVRYSDTYIHKVLEDPSLENFLECSYNFSKLVGFLNNSIEDKLKILKRFLIGYYVKKRVLVIVPERDFLDEVYERVRSMFGVCRIFKLTKDGLRIFLT